MKFVVGIILSDDFNDIDFFDLRNVYGFALQEVDNTTIQCQIGSNQKLYILYDDISECFGNNITPIGAREWLETTRHLRVKDYVKEGQYDGITRYINDFRLKYVDFEAETYMILIRCLKIICDLQYVGFVKMMVEDSCDNMEFPVFDKITIPIRDLDCDVFYNMQANCIYDFT